jgi:hypothetical protein
MNFDETDFEVIVDGMVGTFPMVMSRAKLGWTVEATGITQEVDIVMPLVFVGNKTTQTLMKAIDKSFPVSLAFLKARCQVLTIGLGTDGAKSCKKYGNVLAFQTHVDSNGDGVTSCHAICQLHGGNLICRGTMLALKMSTDLFMATVLMHKGWIFHNLKSKASRMLRGSLIHIEYVMPAGSERVSQYLRVILELFEIHSRKSESEHAQANKAQTKRAKACDRLALLLAASTVNEHGVITRLAHCCPFGCHATPQEGIDEIIDLFKTVFFNAMPMVPACNRWMKLFPNLCWWAASLTFQFFVDLLCDLAAKKEIEAGSELGPLLEADFVGYEDDTSYMRKLVALCKRTRRFVTKDLTRLRILIGVSSNRMLFTMMGEFLTGSKINQNIVQQVQKTHN